MKMVYTDFCRDPFLFQGQHIAQQLHLFFGGEMEDM